MGTLVIETAPGAEVRVEQLRHEFWFGAALASQMFGERANAEEAAQYKKVFLENFNAAVTENALKWPSMERGRGRWTTPSSTRFSSGPTSTRFPCAATTSSGGFRISFSRG